MADGNVVAESSLLTVLDKLVEFVSARGMLERIEAATDARPRPSKEYPLTFSTIRQHIRFTGRQKLQTWQQLHSAVALMIDMAAGARGDDIELKDVLEGMKAYLLQLSSIAAASPPPCDEAGMDVDN